MTDVHDLRMMCLQFDCGRRCHEGVGSVVMVHDVMSVNRRQSPALGVAPEDMKKAAELEHVIQGDFKATIHVGLAVLA